MAPVYQLTCRFHCFDRKQFVKAQPKQAVIGRIRDIDNAAPSLIESWLASITCPNMWSLHYVSVTDFKMRLQSSGQSFWVTKYELQSCDG